MNMKLRKNSSSGVVKQSRIAERKRKLLYQTPKEKELFI